MSKAELERTIELISAGVLVAGDVFELEATIASQEQAVVQADNTLRLAKINLAQLLLITDYENFDIFLYGVRCSVFSGHGRKHKENL